MVAALSAHLAAWEFSTGLHRLIVAVDNDPAEQNAAHRLAERAKADGVDVDAMVSRGVDFNDDLRATSPAQLLKWWSDALG